MFRNRIHVGALALGLVVGASLAAHAAGIWSTFPAAPDPLSGSEVGAFDTQLSNGATPQTAQITSEQLRSINMLQSTPVTTNTITALNGTNLVQITPAGTLAALTIIMPPVPTNGQKFAIWSSQIITALTLTPSTGGTVNQPVTALAVNTPVEWVYQASNTTWYRDR